MKPTVVWTEIPVTDLDTAMRFYGEVFGWTLSRDDTGPNPMATFGGADGNHGHLYPGTPARDGVGQTVHLLVPDALEAAATRCTASGGTLLGEPIAIPPGRFQYAMDPDGNSIGLFEAA